MWGVIALLVTAAIIVAGIWIMAKGKVVVPPTPKEVADARRLFPSATPPASKVVKVRWVGALLLAVGALLLGLETMTTVPARTIAVTTAFGKPTGTIGNGFHLIAPWESTNEFEASLQTLKLSGDNDDNGEPINVRLASGATAQVDVTVQWQVDPKANITQLFLDYREFANLDKNVVRRHLASAANEVFESYDPLASLKGDSQPVSLGGLAEDLKTRVSDRMPTGVLIRDILISKINFDGTTQEKINALQSAIADTKIAEQRQKTATAQAEANRLLAAVKASDGVLYQNCLDMVERMVKEGKVLPAAFSCGAPIGTVVSVK